MKFILMLIFASSNLLAHVPEGTYRLKHSVMVLSFGTKKACLLNRGKWYRNEESCILRVADQVTIRQNFAGYFLNIRTISNNLATCDFNGPARVSGRKIIAEVPAASGLCRISAELSKDGRSLNVNSNENCQAFCRGSGFLGGEFKRTLFWNY